MNETSEIFKKFISENFKKDKKKQQKQTNKLTQDEDKRLLISLNDLRSFDRGLVNDVLKSPSEIIPILEEELKKNLGKHLFIGFTGSVGENNVTPRTVSSDFLGKMVCIEGIVTSVSLCRPKIMKSVHYNSVKNVFYEKDYRDSTMVTKLPSTNTVYPTRDQDGTPLSTEFGLSEYFDHQTILLQEMPENAPPGQLPRSVDIILTFDLVDRVKPGDRIKAYGIYKALCFGNNQFPSRFKTVLIVNNLEVKKNSTEIVVDKTVMKTFIKMSKNPSIYNFIAPSIFGHNHIKKALALMMVGGNEIIMKNGSKIRGDINILLVGDPSTAKSQLLRYVYHASPLSIATTGKGSSGVGLTAAVVFDKDTGDKRLEAGAMVLADRGIVCIDEFDKMNEGDRVAIHEVMEQQTVTIAKAGIHTTLNARCSVLAAANPIYGQYKESKPPHDNVRLPESILTRFDLIFITLDKSSSSIDQKISSHVIKVHTFSKQEDDEMPQDVFRSYLQFCKQKRPVLSRNASKIIIEKYKSLRKAKERKDQIVSVTPRMLETMIRLSTAHAKLRLSDVVEEGDVEYILELLDQSLHQKIVKRAKRVKHDIDAAENGDEVKRDLEKLENENIKEDYIINLLYEIRMNDDCIRIIDINEIVSRLDDGLGITIEDVRDVLVNLSLKDIILFEDDKVFFLS